MDGHQQHQYGGGQGAVPVPGEDHANQYLAYSEQQQHPAQTQHHAQHMQYTEQDHYSHDEYIHQHPQTAEQQYPQQQQYQYDQRQQQRPPQQHEVPPQHYAAEGGGGPAHAQPPQPPLMDQEAANAEILAVRRSALTVFSPLTYTWVSLTVRTTNDDAKGRDPMMVVPALRTTFYGIGHAVWRAGFLLIFVSLFISNNETKKLERSGSKEPYFASFI